MIYLVFVCFCVFFTASWMQIRREGKHDDVLFPFCQLRRDVMKYRYEAIIDDALSLEAVASLRRLSKSLDVTIHNYKRHRTVMFDIRKMAECLRQYRHTIKRMDPVDLTDNAAIREFHRRFVHCFAKAFLAYTPLIRSELALRLVVFVYRKHLSHYVLAVAKQIRIDKQQNSVLESSVTA